MTRLARRAGLAAALAVSGPFAAAQDLERPFGPEFIWNAPISGDAEYRPVPGLDDLPIGVSAWLVPDHVSVPLSAASETDPRVAVLHHPQAWSGRAGAGWQRAAEDPELEARIRAGLVAAFPFPYHPYVSQSATEHRLPQRYRRRPTPETLPLRIHLPPDARPSGNTDGHLVIAQPDGSVFEAYAATILSDGTIVALSYNLTDPGGSGDGAQNGVTASMIPVYAGLLRRDDISRGRIDHALKIVVPASLLAPRCVYPAFAFDRGALREDPPYAGSLPMGARLALPMHLDLESLGLSTRFGRMVADAAQRHGLIVVDRGGAGVTLIAEAGLDDVLPITSDRLRDLERIADALMQVEPSRFDVRTAPCAR